MQRCSAFDIQQDICALQQFAILLIQLVKIVRIQLRHFKCISHLHFSDQNVHIAKAQILMRHSCFQELKQFKQIFSHRYLPISKE